MVNAGGQRADVARTRGGRVARGARVGRVGAWRAWDRGTRSAWERVGTRWSAWGRVAGPLAARGGACLKSQKLLATRGGAYEVRSGRFWSQWTDRDEIYPMKVVLRQTETWR